MPNKVHEHARRMTFHNEYSRGCPGLQIPSKTVEENEKEKDKIDKAKLNKRVKIITMMRERIGLWTKKEGSEEKEKTMVKTKNRKKIK